MSLLLERQRMRDCMGFEKYRYSVALSDELVGKIGRKFVIQSMSTFAGKVRRIRTRKHMIVGNIEKNYLICTYRERDNLQGDISEFESFLEEHTYTR